MELLAIPAYLALDGLVYLTWKIESNFDTDRLIKNVDKYRREGETPKEYAKRHKVRAPWMFPVSNFLLKREYQRLEKAMEQRMDLEELAFLERRNREELRVLEERENMLGELNTDAAGLYANVVLNSTSKSYGAY